MSENPKGREDGQLAIPIGIHLQPHRVGRPYPLRPAVSLRCIRVVGECKQFAFWKQPLCNSKNARIAGQSVVDVAPKSRGKDHPVRAQQIDRDGVSNLCRRGTLQVLRILEREADNGSNQRIESLVILMRPLKHSGAG